MIKRLSILNGFAIIAVVLNHAAGLGQQSIFLSTGINNATSTANWDQLGSFTYYLFIIIRQIANFSVPSFFFISGYFIVYVLRGSKDNNRSVIISRLKNLIIPYLIWSLVYFGGQYVVGKPENPIEYILSLFSIGGPGPFWFIPPLCLFTLLAIFITPLVKANWKRLLLVVFLVQLAAKSIFYTYLFHVPGSDVFMRLVPFYSPLNSICFFTFGIVIGQNFAAIKEILVKYQKLIIIALVTTALLNIIESDFLIRYTLDININAYFGTLTFDLFAWTFLLMFVTVDQVPQVKFISWIGGKSYGIYLLHFMAMEIILKFVTKFAPQMLATQVLFQPLIIVAGLGVPLAIMVLVAKSPVRRYYRFLFS
jgi:peptidoglycan/LPS O-acetylase OafA/YrhL